MNARSKTTLLGAVAVTALTMTAGMGVAGAAQPGTAASGISICKDAGGKNCTTRQATTVWDLAVAVGSSWQDSISSIGNNSGYNICFYEHNNHQGRSFIVPNGQGVNDLSTIGFNDSVSSWKPC
ncbi:peptidase inhibitor family I36 protein [Streptomyces sp. ADI93-02]|uniref:peptidase inhibitor family I36 protein n=1 Tax=Streptomyces sp. ADI93-02 TaxID=1522757 RepID=UPI000F555ADC|nr:peptidase inhibitor family I36 protein [Streptomyces sp. ADI93-02]RPK33554.1 hypothetical protein EES40_35590 [Streptomyces sp. ADI93-02]